MATKDVKNALSIDKPDWSGKTAHFWQVDHQVKKVAGSQKVIVLPSPLAWEKFIWARKWLVKKPKEGYFVWVKKQVDFPLATCLSIASPKISQDLTNLLVIEKGIKVKAGVVCQAIKKNLCGTHRAKGKLILKEGSQLEYNHLHRWGQKDFVSPDYEFILQKDARLIYNYRNLQPPQETKLKTFVHLDQHASCQLNLIANCQNSKMRIEETIFLEGKGSQTVARLRLVVREKSQVEAKTTIVAQKAGKGHLDCQGLLVDKKSIIKLTPQLICKDKDAQITHEASIGRISEEALTYLRTRGLTEKEAIDLIITGFLRKQS